MILLVAMIPAMRTVKEQFSVVSETYLIYMYIRKCRDSQRKVHRHNGVDFPAKPSRIFQMINYYFRTELGIGRKTRTILFAILIRNLMVKFLVHRGSSTEQLGANRKDSVKPIISRSYRVARRTAVYTEISGGGHNFCKYELSA